MVVCGVLLFGRQIRDFRFFSAYFEILSAVFVEFQGPCFFVDAERVLCWVWEGVCTFSV